MINVTKTEMPPLSEYMGYLKKIWKSSWLTNDGEFITELEKKLARYLDVPYVVCVANGTLAIQLALKALDLSGEVITTPFTFPATTNAIIWEGLTPVFADIEYDTFNLDPTEVVKKITPKSSAILAVHVYGNPCEVEKLQEIAKRFKLKLIFDAAHAFGVKYKNRSVLQYGDISTLSFHATKIFSSAEGGAIIVKDKKIYEKLRLLRNFGIKNEDEVVLPGINAKMNELQAALGLCNIKTIDKRINACKKIYLIYLKRFRFNPNIRLQKLVSSRHNYCYMPIVLKSRKIRNSVFKKLVNQGIKPRKYFYPLISDFDHIRKYTGSQKLRVAKRVADGILCLPIFPSLNLKNTDRIIKIVTNYFK